MLAVGNPVDGKSVVVGVAGGIAAYKAAELTRAFIKAGADVRCAMTKSGQEFIGPMTLQALTGAPVATDLFDLTQESEIGHIQVADGADIVVVAPATANVIARMAAGMANDIVTAVTLATRAPVLVERGFYVVGPGDGFLACRWTGPGRMAEPADIVEAACNVLTHSDLAGRRIVVSAGPTHEPIDPVRYIANRSSGRMGFALARAALRRGAHVTLVSGPVALEPPAGVTLVQVTTAREMDASVARFSRGADAVIMAAAVGDFRPRVEAKQKIKKKARGRPTVELSQNPDILARLGKARGRKRKPVLVGFAAETKNVVAHAKKKLATKGCDLIVANDVSQSDAGFDVTTNRVTIIGTKTERVALASKDEVAQRILDRVAKLL